MFESIRKLINCQEKAERKRRELMRQVHKALETGRCVILGETPQGTRVIILGKGRPILERQVEKILAEKGVE